MARERAFAELLRNAGSDAVVVADLETVRPPQNTEIALRRDLGDPPRRDPCPWTAGVHVELDDGHDARLRLCADLARQHSSPVSSSALQRGLGFCDEMRMWGFTSVGRGHEFSPAYRAVVGS